MKMKSVQIRILAGAGLLLTTMIWGFAFVVVKNSLDKIPPTYMLAFRFSIAAVCLGIFFMRRLPLITPTVFRQGVVLGLLLFLSYLLQTIGCQYTTAGKNAFLTTVYVVLVPFLNWPISKIKPNAYCLSAAFLAIIGIGLLSLNGDLAMNVGDVLTLLCGIGYALHLIYISRYTQESDPVLLTVLQLAAAACFSWISAPFLDGGFPVAVFEPDMAAGMLYLGLFSTMLAFLLQNVCQKYVAPDTAAVLLSMESVFGVLFSVLLLGEAFSVRMIAGCALILGAVLVAGGKSRV